MLDKDRLIAVTKSDLLDEELRRDISLELDKDLDIDYIFISSVANNGISELKDRLWNLLND
jgi:GTP-binding protein